MRVLAIMHRSPSRSRAKRRRRGLDGEGFAAFCFVVGEADAVDDGDGGKDGKHPKGSRHHVPALEESAEDDENDPFRALHEANLALTDERLGARAGVADHKTGGHDEGDEADVEVAVAAGVEDQQTEKEGYIGVAVEHRVEEGAEDGDLIGLAGDTAIDHIEESRADDDQAGVKEHADVVFRACIAEEERGDYVDEEADEGERVGRDTRQSETIDDLLQQPAAAFAECACPGHVGMPGLV